MSMDMDFSVLAPEIVVLTGAVTALLAGSFSPRNKQWISRLIAALAVTVGAGFAVAGTLGKPETVFAGTFAVDTATGVARAIICVATLLVIALGGKELTGTSRESETYSLILLSALGAMVMSGTSDLLVLAVGYLLASIPLYALIGMGRSPHAAEAALKTYLLGAFFGIALMLGVAVLYALAGGSTYDALNTELTGAPAAATAVGLVGVLAGLAFKAGAVPGHFWIPDAAQGAGITAATFLTTVPKVGAIIAAYRLLSSIPDTVDWPLLIGLLSVASMTLGNFAAYFQTDVRRLLGWSTVSQAGYLLVPVAVAGHSTLALPSLLFYLAAYAVSNVGAFAVIAATGRYEVEDYRGLIRTAPWLAGALLISLLSLVGTPPTAVFVGKLTTFTAGWDGGLPWLVVLAALNTVVSLFYYLRWIAPAFARSPATPKTRAASDQASSARASSTRGGAASTAAIAGMAVLALGLSAGLLWPWLQGPLAR
ncbi:NADH-quinone oxidoreductase subunit N [Arthrobacter echini]|nr:NADH-quinone oxidoreductase subunit N [Arthrobacter echini]